MTRALSIGKYRSLQQCSTTQNTISILALDHRNNLRQALHPDQPDKTTNDEIISFKLEVVEKLSRAASAVLLDPEFSAGQCIAAGVLPGKTGLVIACEETGYGGDPTSRMSMVLPGWSADKTRKMGASALKLLVYYHPQSPTALEIEHLVQKVAAACAEEDIAFFLEPLSYSLDPTKKKLSNDERRKVVIETARRLTPLGADILKAEFPVDISLEPDQTEWKKACDALSQASEIPWVLLSASVDYEKYLRMVTIACQSGASGVAAGRAVWKEAAEYYGIDRSKFLCGIALSRMERVTALCEGLAKSWTSSYTCPAISLDWYQKYGEK
jgi:tagatose 1,6-diphosphate aldolase